MNDKINNPPEIDEKIDKYAHSLPTSRLETLADGIFAIAMTLLVLSIEVPTLSGNMTPSLLMEYVLYTIIPEIAIYILSFALLGSFWLTHQVFFIIKRSDTKLIWINIFWLMSIAIVPFSTSMVGKYGGFQLSQLIFSINMLIIGILSYINWTYAANRGMIKETIGKITKNTTEAKRKAIQVQT